MRSVSRVFYFSFHPASLPLITLRFLFLAPLSPPPTSDSHRHSFLRLRLASVALALALHLTQTTDLTRRLASLSSRASRSSHASRRLASACASHSVSSSLQLLSMYFFSGYLAVCLIDRAFHVKNKKGSSNQTSVHFGLSRLNEDKLFPCVLSSISSQQHLLSEKPKVK